jgi:fibronectin type 3 domain-containing protein
MYYYRLRAFIGENSSAYSVPAGAATSSLPVPVGLGATAVSSSRIDVVWNPASGAAGYYVYRSGSQYGYYSAVSPLVAASATRYSDTGLSAGTTYWYKVRSYYAGGFLSNISAEASAMTMIDAPSNITAATVSTSEINVTWTAVSGAVNYDLYRSASGGAPWTKIAATSATSYLDGSLNSGTQYWYKVAANCAGFTGADSGAASAWTKPLPPQGISAVAKAGGGIQVIWTANGADAYYVYRSVSSGGTYTQVGNVTASSFTDASTAANTTYYYKVQAWRNVASDYSGVVSAKTAPVSPATVTATAQSQTGIQVSWTAVTGAATYDVYYSASSSAPAAGGTATRAGVTSPCTLTGLSVGTTYYMWVRAKNADGLAGAWSTRASAQTHPAVPSPPTVVTATAVSVNAIYVTWGGGSTAPYFNLYRATGEEGPYTIVNTGIAGHYNDNSLAAGTTYFYKVSAVNISGESALSAAASAKTFSTGLFVKSGASLTAVAGVASPFSIANALTWLKTNAQADTDSVILIAAGESLAPQTLSTANLNGKSGVSITLMGVGGECTVQVTEASPLFTVTAGVTLNLDANIRLSGPSSANYSLVLVNGSLAKLVMKAGATIKDMTFLSNGVPVEVKAGNFTMTGGEISGINGTHGAVFVNGSGTSFTMTGGKLCGNMCSYGGGTQIVSGSFTMSGGEISGNHSIGYGGGVCVGGSGGSFIMTGGIIAGNTANSSGGGVYVAYQGYFNKSGNAVIYGSEASESLKNTTVYGTGQAVFVYDGYKKRNATAGAGVDLNGNVAGSAGGWE